MNTKISMVDVIITIVLLWIGLSITFTLLKWIIYCAVIVLVGKMVADWRKA